MADLNNGLVLHLPMNEGYGLKVYDYSRYQNHGTITGAVFVQPYNDMSVTSEEEGEAPIVIADDDQTAFWTVHQESSGSKSLAISDETTIKHKGTNSLKLAISAGAYDVCAIYHIYSSYQDWSRQDFITFWWYGTNSNGSIPIELWSDQRLSGGSNFYQYVFIDNFFGWRRLIFPLKVPYQTFGSPSLSTVKEIWIWAHPIAIGTPAYLDRITVDVGNWRFGDALYFNGVTNHADLGDMANFTSEDFSISFHLTPFLLSGIQRLLLKGNPNNGGWTLYLVNTDIYFDMCNSGAFTTQTTNSTLILGKSKHIAIVRDGTTKTAKIYVEGVDVTYASNASDAGIFAGNLLMGITP